jgi:hypothetical protein
VAINDTIDFDGGIVTWIQNLNGDEPYGNDLDPTLQPRRSRSELRNHARWRIVENADRLETLRRIVRFQRRLVDSGAFADPRSHIYYLPELYCAYVGRCYAAFRAMPEATQRAVDPDGSFEPIRAAALAYARDVLSTAEMNPFDAALALLALAKLGGRSVHVRAGARAPGGRLRRRQGAGAVPGLRVEQDEDAHPHPGRRPGGHLGLRPVGPGPCARGDAALTEASALAHTRRAAAPAGSGARRRSPLALKAPLC